MSFLRSVIADARPRRPMLEPSENPTAITGWKTRGLDGDVSGAEAKSPGAADQMSRFGTSLPTREDATDFNMDDAPTFREENQVNRDFQDIEFHVEPEDPLSVHVDKFGPFPDEESSTLLDTGNSSDREPDTEGGNASKTDKDMPQQPADTIIPDSRMKSPKDRDNDSSIASPETHGVQIRVPGHEETEPTSSPASILDTPGKEFADNDSNSLLHMGAGAGQLGVDETMSSYAEGNMPAQAEVVGVTAADDRHHSERPIKGPETFTRQTDATQAIALTSSESSRRIESSVLKKSFVPSVPSPDASGKPALDSAAAVKDVLRDAQLVGAMDSHISSDMELATIPDSADRNVSTSVSSPKPGSSKPASTVQHMARSAKTSANPETLLSVPARPFQAELVSKDGDSFHSKAPLRSPQKKHEAPKVQIGQIDVIVEAAAQPATKPAPAPSSIDLASRHYLRRL